MRPTKPNIYANVANSYPDVDMTIRSWCLKEATYWRRRGVDLTSALEKFRNLNETRPSITLFEIKDGQVTMTPKPGGLREGPVLRARLYHEFLRKTVKAFSLDINITMAVDLDDGGLALDDFPIFSFQKLAETNAILLPDVDFLDWKFYTANPDHIDPIPYDKKIDSAIFVGASSGGYVTREAIELRSHPRLRSAMFFAGNAKVNFLIPVVVQYDAEETKELLRNMGIGTGNRVEWPEQFRHKFLISMDGNGATCSRVAISLKSNSVLLKYKSPHQLYYFSGLIPWLHFVPIEHDSDIISVIELEEKCPGYFRMFAHEGQNFARNYLGRYPSMKYTALLLRMYASCFEDAKELTTKAEDDFIDLYRQDNSPEIDILAHVQNSGDIWCSGDSWVNAPGSKIWLEGFAIEPRGSIQKFDLRYQTIAADGSLTDWSHAGEFCGTRGKNLPLMGLRIELLGNAAVQFDCEYYAHFVDGSEIGPVRMGELCKPPKPVPLEAFRLVMMLIG